MYSYDDDDGPMQTGIECPFCGHELETQPPYPARLYCDNCEVAWTDSAAVELDRQELAAAPFRFAESGSHA